MKTNDMPIRFFLGANTPSGFTGFAEELYDGEDGWQAYLIKSGAGTGKATLMRRVYEVLGQHSLTAEAICCSSDPSSLDGVRVPELKLCILDATAPHVVEPRCWGAVEQLVPLSVCMDEVALHEHVDEILAVTQENKALHAACRKYIRAAGALLRENRRIGEEQLDRDKVRRLACRLARQEFGNERGTGRLAHRFLSAVTPEGVLTFYETLQALCPRIYAIEDDTGAAAALLLGELARHAADAGVEGVVCPCPLLPQDTVDHLLFPSLGVGFTASNSFHKVDFPVYRHIHAARFTDHDALREKRQMLQFNRRAARDLLGQAVALSREAKAVHDRMEEYSAAAMDWERAARIGDAVVERFRAVAQRYLATRESDSLTDC